MFHWASGRRLSNGIAGCHHHGASSSFPRLPFIFTFQYHKMKVKLLLDTFLAFSLLFFSCNKYCEECYPAPTRYTTGVFVVNEGPWGGTGTISWFNPATGEVQDSIYEKANSGAVLGQFVQSLTFHNGKGYIVVNGANRVVVVDAETFEYLDTIGGLALPRYFLAIDYNTAYISQWGADGVSGSVARVDLTTNEVVKVIPTGSGPEKMTLSQDGTQLLVPNSGGYGTDSTLASFYLNKEDELVKTILPGQKNPCCFNTGSTLYGLVPRVLCKGDWTDANAEGWIGKPFDLFEGHSAPKGSDDLAVFHGAYYFTSGTAVYDVALNLPPRKLFDQAAYGLAVHPITGDLYCSDAKDFNSAGAVVIRRQDGATLGTFRAGIAPGEIIIIE
ncbi:MAG: hypothetical protein RIQ78_1573 [Bacteroidota bacterium]